MSAEEHKLGNRASAYVVDQLPGENEFEAMVRRHNERKRMFYSNLNQMQPNSKVDDGNLGTNSQIMHLDTTEKIQRLHDNLGLYKISFTQGSNVLKIHRDTLFQESFTQFLTMDHQKVLIFSYL